MVLEEEYQLEFFRANGFQRRVCERCSQAFWGQDPERTLCGDPPCVRYAFIGQPVTRKRYGLAEMREKFLGFLEERGHARVGRYPVVARWRDDVYLTIASIAVFQPHVTAGEVPPPANPLAISQPCIRLTDLDSVGRSGRHLTSFEMMAHHAFNGPEGEVYWKDRTVELCHEFLTKALGVGGAGITYKEKPWAGGGNAGPAVEVLVGGLEVATLVFMNLRLDPAGAVELYGERYGPMPLRIVDTGYGLERLVWASNGAPTIYEALWPELLQELRRRAGLEHTLEDPELRGIVAETVKLSGLMAVDTDTRLLALREQVAKELAAKGLRISARGLEEKLRPLEGLYALADHTRTLAFLLGDGLVPSNVKGGYLARLLVRRTLRLLEELQMEAKLGELLDLQLEALAKDFPELRANRDVVLRIAELEAERYRDAMEKGTRLVERELRRLGKGQALPAERLIEFYDSNGVHPDVVKQAGERLGVHVEVPDDFFNRVAALHSSERRGPALPEALPKELQKLPRTKLLYYESPLTKEFDAVVLWAKGDEVILDQCAFYPEGGGQPADAGYLTTEDDTLHEVTDVQARGGLVVLKVAGGRLRRGQVVHGRVDWGKRLAHTRAHTATHIVLAASRRVLGGHVWQTGAQKGQDVSRLDVQHYQRISDEELRQIEQLANLVVMEDLPVEKLWLDRTEAEKRFGVQLFQGGVPKGKVVRVVKIQDFDVECCGGTHVRHTSEVGPIKVLRTEPIQDGVHRIEFSAGMAAVRRIQERDVLLAKAADALGVKADQLPLAVERFFGEWKQLRKQVEELTALAAEARKGKLLAAATQAGRARLVVSREVGASVEQLITLGAELAKEPGVVAVLGSEREGRVNVVVARARDVALDAGEVAREASKVVGGGGGGKPELGQGGGPEVARLDEALEAAAALARRRLAS